MSKAVLQGIFWATLLGSLQWKPIMAQECPQNAANPKAATAVYDANDTQRRTVIFKPGADGVLRALDAGSGGELWAFTPSELDITHRADGLMSDVRVLRFDADRNGSIEPAAGDRVWLYFGMRRGGRYYYALDVTDSGRPQVLWKIGPAELPGVGETWSVPTLARVRIAGAVQNGEHFVLILSGGYDELLPSAHRIFIVDAATGRLLWYAGGAGGIETPAAPDLALTQMTDAVSARVAAIDTDGDRFADRLYAADLGGRVWRFDILNGHDRSQLVAGGVLASLAGAAQDARRFFNAPDVALIQRRGAQPYYNLAIGSGDRAQPADAAVHDRFYVIRDRNPFGRLTQSSYDRLVPLADADLFDITDSLGNPAVPVAAPGWKLELRLNGGWSGEKVLAEALTLHGTILFTTYHPSGAGTCAGENRMYALNVDHGNPVLDLNDDRQITNIDASILLAQTGVAGEVELTLPNSDIDAAPPTGEPNPNPAAPRTQCKIGEETLRLCVTIETMLRTFWQRNSVD